MTDFTTISVIIPVKNRPRLIQETLQSVQAQTYPHWEAVVVDDRSTDGTKEAVAAMAGDDERIRLLQRPGGKQGASVCRNIGWQNARGDYIIFLDSDDLLAESCLEERVQVMETHPELDFAVFGAYFFNEVPGDREEVFNVPTSEDPLDRFLKLDLPWQTAGPIYRRSAIEQIGEWNENLSCGQDVDYGVRSLCQGLQYRYTERMDYYLRTGNAEESLGDEPWCQKNLPARQKRVESTYRVMSATDNITNERRIIIAGNFLHIAESWAEGGKNDKACDVWNVAKKLSLVSKQKWKFLNKYLRIKSTLIRRYVQYYIYHNFEKDLIISGFSIGRNEKGPRRPKKYDVSDHRNPYSKYAVVLLNGPFGFTIRHMAKKMNLKNTFRYIRDSFG
jgi:glycosyltransferase involved in cell wall biosynthesis